MDKETRISIVSLSNRQVGFGNLQDSEREGECDVSNLQCSSLHIRYLIIQVALHHSYVTNSDINKHVTYISATRNTKNYSDAIQD